MTAYYGRNHIEVTFAGNVLPNVYAAQTRHDARSGVAEARVVVRDFPSTGTYDDPVTIAGGRTLANIGATRFTGYYRDEDDDLFPGMHTLHFLGEMQKAAEFENSSSVALWGGLPLSSLVGANYAADEDIVVAILDACGVTYTAGDIGGTGRLMGNQNPFEWVWRAGTPTDVDQLQLFREQGQKGFDYIREIDRISAVASGPSGGFYSTFDCPSTPKRKLIGARPGGSPDLTFTEGIDILRGSKIQRLRPIANAVLAKGWDPGLGIGPVEAFVQSSNTFMPSSRPIIDPYSSPLIEFSTEAQASANGTAIGAGGPEGMSCELVRDARLLDVNREPVTGFIITYRDDLIEPGQAHLVQGPGGAPGRLRAGEELWCIANTCTWERRGGVLVFRQRPEYVGGGVA